jgi:hypothetical protein
MPAKSPARSKKKTISIDFPVDGEQIIPGHYAVRISAGPLSLVEINVGGKEWYPCRESLSYYWFDWNPVKPGRVKLTARYARGLEEGATSERTCTVVGGGTN